MYNPYLSPINVALEVKIGIRIFKNNIDLQKVVRNWCPCYLAGRLINPLTPVPPVTACDEPWPFFHFWRHHFWPKLASSILNFCRRKRSFHWCPDQSDWPIGAWDMHKNAQNVRWKTWSKISCNYTWLLHGKNFTPQWCFLRSYLLQASPVEGQSL